MSKNKSQNFLVSLVVYPMDIMFSIGQSDKQLREDLKCYGIHDDEFNCFDMPAHTTASAFHNDDTHRTIVRFRKVPETNKELGCLAHEIFHAVDMILRDIQITLSSDSDEAYAYLIDYVTVQFWEKVKIKKS